MGIGISLWLGQLFGRHQGRKRISGSRNVNADEVRVFYGAVRVESISALVHLHVLRWTNHGVVSNTDSYVEVDENVVPDHDVIGVYSDPTISDFVTHEQVGFKNDVPLLLVKAVSPLRPNGGQVVMTDVSTP